MLLKTILNQVLELDHGLMTNDFFVMQGWGSSSFVDLPARAADQVGDWQASDDGQPE